MPLKVKRTSLTLRILRNCKLEPEWETKAEFLSNFMEQMRMSGYVARERGDTEEHPDRMVVEDKESRRRINRAFSWKPKRRVEERAEVEEEAELVLERWRV